MKGPAITTAWVFQPPVTFDASNTARGHFGDLLYEQAQAADLLYQQGDWQAALDAYKAIADTQGQHTKTQFGYISGWTQYRIAHAYLKLGQLVAAESKFWLAFKNGLPSGQGGDKDYIALCAVGIVCMARGDVDDAIAAFRLSRRNSDNGEAIYALGQVLYMTGQLADARQVLLELARGYSFYPVAAELLALIKTELRPAG